MIRTLSLAGEWQFALDEACEGESLRFYANALSDTITLPGTTAQAQKGALSDRRETGYLTELYPFSGWAWYQKTVHIAPEALNKPLLLTLERTRLSALWVNHEKIGSCDSLNTPHRYLLAPVSAETDLHITVRISNRDYPTGGGHLTSPDTQTNWNGITGEISLAVLDDVRLEQIRTYPDICEKSVTIRARLVGADFVQLTASAVSVSLDGEGAHTVDETKFDLTAQSGEICFTLPLGTDALLWSEHTPVFYRISLCICGTDETATVVCGLREFSANGLEFQINGTPTFLRGKHDGLIFPLTGAAPTDTTEWIRILSIAKRYGINHYRYHTCCPPEAAFTAADLLGIYMQPELPFWGTLAAPGEEGYNEAEQDYLIREGFRMLDAFGNHPSFCMMSLGNELWGSADRMGEILRGYHAHDPRHLYTQGSNNFQFWPQILPEDDFFSGVRMEKERLFRGSYAMCDAPLGHIQTTEPSTRHNYDAAILPAQTQGVDGGEREIEIQYGTGVKKVKVSASVGGLIPTKPVVSHEIGQFCVYPDFREIEKYTGVLRARNFECFRERLHAQGMLDQALDFFTCSGKLAVQCYKEELEAAMRSQHLAGYQILDIQDFSGQGTALVGILDAFMDSKGLVTENDWRGFCQDAVLLAQFDRYVLQSGAQFTADIALRCYRPDLSGTVCWSLTCGNETIREGTLPLPEHPMRLVSLGTIFAQLPTCEKATALTLTLSIPGTDIQNHYTLELMPDASSGMQPQSFRIAHTLSEAKTVLASGGKVLLLPNTVKEKIAGFYCTDFWCYPMFRSISESMGKPVPVGTMGLLINQAHPAVSDFATERYSTPQWYQIVSHADCAILDHAPQTFRPIVQMIDNFERNHRLGILFEAKVGAGSLLVCTARLDEIAAYTEGRAFAAQLMRYADSEQFAPEQSLPIDLLESLFD
ncbi:MAG: beta-glucuronidase [Ruminococcus sp.]|nr:beta-glucuronidase [Ruminococcus sp.]